MSCRPDQKFLISVRTRHWGRLPTLRCPAHTVEPHFEFRAGGADCLSVRDDPAFPDILLSNLKLRFEQSDQVRAFGGQGKRWPKHFLKPDKARITDNKLRPLP